MGLNHDINGINLTAAEIGHLWETYMANSKAKYIMQYAIEKIKNQDIKSVIQEALDLSNRIVKSIEEIYKSVNHPIPHAFNNEDVDIKAANIFSDTLWLCILKSFTSFGLSNYGNVLGEIARADVKEFFIECANDTIKLTKKIDDIKLEKGIFERTPNIPIPEEVEFAKSQSIMGSIKGNKRVLSALEIANTFNTAYVCSVCESLHTGLSQVTKDKKIKEHLVKGKKMLLEQREALNSLLLKEELNSPRSYKDQIFNTTDSPFSGKITLYFSMASISELLMAYFVSLLATVRKDINLILVKHSTELMTYVKDGIDILIDHGWFEEVPKNISRKDIIEK